MDASPTPLGPYATGAVALFNHGWAPIPLPPQAKRMKLIGWTGTDGAMPDQMQVATWLTTHAHGNIAIRLPKNVVGIDVDAYGSKIGADTFIELQEQLGALPLTYKITSRDDEHSGIRLFRLPDGADETQFRGGWPNVDVIRHSHRYVVAPPSIHPDTGQTYRAIDESTGVVDGNLPPIEQLPELPEGWLAALYKDAPQQPVPQPRPATAPVSNRATHDLCPSMSKALDRALTDLASGLGRHDAATRHALILARLGEQGHNGVEAALSTFSQDFIGRIASDRTGGTHEARREWDSILATALTKISHNPTAEVDKGCCGAVALGETSITAQLGGIVPTSMLMTGTRNATSHPGDQSHSVATAGQPGSITEASSWLTIDLTEFIDGSYEPPKATILRRSDGNALFYPSLVHSIYGESESGKSWITQIAVVTVLAAGGTATLIDFESSPGEVVARLQALGATKEQLRNQLRYIGPEARPTADDPAWIELLSTTQDFVVIDGVTESLVMFGAKTESNDEVTAWMRTFPRLIASQTGAAVVLVDHVVKNKDERSRFAIGAQAKLAAINGAAYIAEPIDVVAPGLISHIELRVAKDRPGFVRAFSGERRADRTQLAATIRMDSTISGVVTFTVLSAEEGATVATAARAARADSFRPTGLMERISKFLEVGGAESTNAVRKAMGGKAVHVDQALQLLVDEGFVARHDGPRGAVMHKAIAEYREIGELVGETASDLVPPRPDLVPDEVNTLENPPRPTSSPLRPDLVPDGVGHGQGDFVPQSGETPFRGSPAGTRSARPTKEDQKNDLVPERSQTQSKRLRPSGPTSPQTRVFCAGCGVKLDPVLTNRGYHYGCEPEDFTESGEDE